jgi:hypothetical protein
LNAHPCAILIVRQHLYWNIIVFTLVEKWSGAGWIYVKA